MASGQYLRIYYSLIDEYPDVWSSDRLLSTYVRLLLIAEKWWPQYAPQVGIFRGKSFTSLVDCGLLLVSDDGRGFTIKGLDKQRSPRSEHGKRAASSRWSSAESSAQSMLIRSDHIKSSSSEHNGSQSPGSFMGFKPKPGFHDGSHHDCLVCEGRHPSNCSECRHATTQKGEKQ